MEAQTQAQTTSNATPAQQLAERNRNTESRLAFGQAREDLSSYAEAGVFYASQSPVANSVGGEVGIVTRDEKTGEVRRSGVGFYMRSDHMCNLPFMDLSTLKIERTA